MWLSIVAIFQELLKLLNNVLPTRAEIKEDAIDKQKIQTDKDIDAFIDKP